QKSTLNKNPKRESQNCVDSVSLIRHMNTLISRTPLFRSLSTKCFVNTITISVTFLILPHQNPKVKQKMLKYYFLLYQFQIALENHSF
ncbi:MAG: hypothetical protein IJ830_01465, partial [Alphaproteobacteria bacterium]|nr:hypothetical protein [Alphaproteobacteria bacterium]